MDKRVYRYPLGTRLFMTTGVATTLFMVLSFLWYLMISFVNIVDHIPNPPDRFFLLLTLFLGALFDLYIINAYPDVEVTDDGLLLNASGIRFHVPWSKISKTNRGYGKVFKTFVVETQSLTPLHRMYGVMYRNSFAPSFLIWSILPNYEKLISEIKAKTEPN